MRDAIREYRRIGKRFEARRARVARVRLERARGAAPKRYLTAAKRVFASFTEEDRLREPSLVVGWRLNVPLYMVEAGELQEAEEHWEAIPRFEEMSLETHRIGIGAFIHFTLGRLDDAESGFREASLRFEEMKMPYDAALVLLHLADLLFMTGRIVETRDCLRRALDLFTMCRLKRHVAKALDRLREALRLKDGLRAAIELAIARASGIVRRHGEGPA